MKYTELEIPLVPFFLSFFAREHPRKQFRNAPRGMEVDGEGGDGGKTRAGEGEKFSNWTNCRAALRAKLQLFHC